MKFIGYGLGILIGAFLGLLAGVWLYEQVESPDYSGPYLLTIIPWLIPLAFPVIGGVLGFSAVETILNPGPSQADIQELRDKREAGAQKYLETPLNPVSRALLQKHLLLMMKVKGELPHDKQADYDRLTKRFANRRLVAKFRFKRESDVVKVELFESQDVQDDYVFEAAIKAEFESWDGRFKVSQEGPDRKDYTPIDAGSEVLKITVEHGREPYMTYKEQLFEAVPWED